MRWTVWTLWTDRSEFILALGPIDNARSAEHACDIARRRGIISGLGFNPKYLGLHAVRHDS